MFNIKKSSQKSKFPELIPYNVWVYISTWKNVSTLNAGSIISHPKQSLKKGISRYVHASNDVS